MKPQNLIKILGPSLLLILLFQNCSGHQFQTLTAVVAQSKSAAGGNGGVYDGKPDVNYFRFIPGLSCNGQPSPAQVAHLINGQYSLFDIEAKDNGSCSETPTIESPVVHSSAFQADFVVLNDWLFKKYTAEQIAEQKGIPNNLAEILCRDDFENPKYEIISHFDRESGQAVTRAYSGDGLVPDFSVSRLLSIDQVRYVSDRLAFTVDFSKPQYPDRKFAGLLKVSRIDKIKTGPLTCVLGGSLDTSRWKVKTLVNTDINNFRIWPTGEITYFGLLSSDTLFSSIQKLYHLFQLLPNGSSTEFMPGLTTASSLQYELRDRNYISYSSSILGGYTAWYLLDFKNSRSIQLTNLVTPLRRIEAYVSDMDVIPTSPPQLIYNTGYFTDFSRTDENVLRSLDLETQKITELIRARDGIGFDSLPQVQKLVVSLRDNTLPSQSRVRYQVFDLKTKTARDLGVIPPPSCVMSGDVRALPGNQSLVLSSAMCGDSRSNDTHILISVANGSLKVVAEKKTLAFASENGEWLIFDDSAYNVSSGKTVSLPSRFNLNFFIQPLYRFHVLGSLYDYNVQLIENRWLLGFSASMDLFKTDLTSGDSQKICENALGAKISLSSMENKKAFLLTYESDLKIYHIYQAKSDGQCVNVNQFPSDLSNAGRTTTNSIGFTLVVSDSDRKQNEAVMIPIDGRPPIKLSSNPVGFWDLGVVPGKNKILFSGPDRNNQNKLFSFEF